MEKCKSFKVNNEKHLSGWRLTVNYRKVSETRQHKYFKYTSSGKTNAFTCITIEKEPEVRKKYSITNVRTQKDAYKRQKHKNHANRNVNAYRKHQLYKDKNAKTRERLHESMKSTKRKETLRAVNGMWVYKQGKPIRTTERKKTSSFKATASRKQRSRANEAKMRNKTCRFVNLGQQTSTSERTRKTEKNKKV